MNANKVRMSDGFNGDTVLCYADPIEVDGNMAKLRVAEPGKEYMVRWVELSALADLRGAA